MGYSRREFLRKTAEGIGASLFTLGALQGNQSSKQNQPNILWITSEDNTASYLGCYGNEIANTPNLDQFAEESIVYENAHANAPVCAPARFTIITGMYPTKFGTHNMRSNNKIPEKFKFFPEYLREQGYYCTNNYKEDYNTPKPRKIWHESSHSAHYKNRDKDQPFFAIFSTSLSHEHKIHFHELMEENDHDPGDLELAPYHPDLPEMRKCKANYYDYISKMDKKVGEILDELEARGLAEDTIVFYYSDHGGVMPRSKRFLYDNGTHVPMMVRFPDKYQHLAPKSMGTREKRLVSFVDLAPTVLSLTGVDIPDNMQGTAFLGKQKNEEPEYIHFMRDRMDERYDMMRAVCNKRYRYIRNYMPHRKYGQHLWYLWRSPSTRAWEEAYKNGQCNDIQSRFWGLKVEEELYDVQKDPHNIHNLADKDDYKNILQKMRAELKNWIRQNNDAGFLPEGMMVERAGDSTIYKMTHSRNISINKIIETSEMATRRDSKYLTKLKNRLTAEEPGVRYWAATGCAILEKEAVQAVSKLKLLLEDSSPDVRIAAAEALVRIGKYKQAALKILVSEMENEEKKWTQLHAVNILESLEEEAKPVLKQIMSWVKWEHGDVSDYFGRAHTNLVKELKPGWSDYVVY